MYCLEIWLMGGGGLIVGVSNTLHFACIVISALCSDFEASLWSEKNGVWVWRRRRDQQTSHASQRRRKKKGEKVVSHFPLSVQVLYYSLFPFSFVCFWYRIVCVCGIKLNTIFSNKLSLALHHLIHCKWRFILFQYCTRWTNLSVGCAKVFWVPFEVH